MMGVQQSFRLEITDTKSSNHAAVFDDIALSSHMQFDVSLFFMLGIRARRRWLIIWR